MSETHHSKPILSLHQVGLFYRQKKHILKHGNKFWALDDVTMDVYSGETIGILGRNGAGKSTLLKVLAGILRPDKGRSQNHHDLNVTLLSLQAGFNPFLTGRQNIIISGMLLGVSRKEMLEKVSSIVELSELGGFINDPVRTYSTGMRARLGFSTAYHIDPDIMLLDEVLGVGDAKFGEKSAALIKEKISSDKTVIVVSHSEHRLKELCTRLIWLDEGKIHMKGTPDEVWEQYRPFYRESKGLRKHR